MSFRSSCSWRVLALVSFAPLLAADVTPVGAQAFRGVVVDDSTRVPLDGAVLTLLDGRGRDVQIRTVRTDSLGRFIVHTPASGQYSLRATRIGYAPLTVERVSFQGGDVVTLTISLSAVPQRLGTVLVAEKRRLNGLELLTDLGFDLRRSKNNGHFLDTVALQIYGRNALLDVLLSHSGLNIIQISGGRGATEVRMQNGLTPQLAPRLCEPEIWIDGVRPAVTQQARIGALTADELYGIEVFSPLRLPPASIAGYIGEEQAEKPTTLRCGIIVIWTKAYIDDLKKREKRQD